MYVLLSKGLTPLIVHPESNLQILCSLALTVKVESRLKLLLPSLTGHLKRKSIKLPHTQFLLMHQKEQTIALTDHLPKMCHDFFIMDPAPLFIGN